MLSTVKTFLVSVSLLLVLVSCNPVKPNDIEQAVDFFRDDPRALANQVLQTTKAEDQRRVAVVKLVLFELSRVQRTALIPVFLRSFIQAAGDDPYLPYYYYLQALAYEAQNAFSFAVQAYRKTIDSPSPILIGDDDIVELSLQRLLDLEENPQEQIALLGILNSRYPDRLDPGVIAYRLALAYQATGQYDLSFEYFRRFLANPQAVIENKANEVIRVKEMLNLASSSRDWTRDTLDQLVLEVRNALGNKDAEAIYTLRAKVNFFAMSWLQDRTDFNSQPNFDLVPFLFNSDRVFSEATVTANSNEQEAFLRTWGWSAYIPVWYLYFRRVDFPADPEIHGDWEWVGIFFGDSLQ